VLLLGCVPINKIYHSLTWNKEVVRAQMSLKPHYNTLQHSATHCNSTPQLTATHCCRSRCCLPHMYAYICVAYKYVGVATIRGGRSAVREMQGVLQCVLQCVADCVAVCCSVWQCVSVVAQNAHLYAYICVHIYMYMYTYIHTCINIYIHMYIYYKYVCRCRCCS